MLDDLTIGIEVDLTPFTAGMAVVETRVSSAPTVNLTPIASEFNVVTDAMARTAVASTSIDTTNIVGSLETVQASIEGVSTAASNAHFSIGGLGRTFTAVAMATKPLVAVPGQLGLISGAAGLAANAAAHVAAAFGLASTLATTMAVGLSIILAPLRGLVLVPRLIAASFSLMFAIVLAPFKVLGFAALATAKAMWMLLQPVLKLAAAIFKLKLFFATLRIQLTLLKLFFGALPPKIRLVVGGLIALGAAGRVGAVACFRR